MGNGQNRLGASCLAQVYGQLGDSAADVDDAELLANFYNALQKANAQGLMSAYHDRSDGGLLVTLVEMAFAGKTGVTIDLTELAGEQLAVLFNEELGAVVQVSEAQIEQFTALMADYGLADICHDIGTLNTSDDIIISRENHVVYQQARTRLRTIWAETTHQMQRLRDNPDCADQEHENKADASDPGLHAALTFDVNEDVAAPYIANIATGAKPKVAILREQGVNSHLEMAAAFTRAGFSAIDVHMSDVLSGRVELDQFNGMAVCGGFSYGDVLGAGEGWAKSILFNAGAREQFQQFFNRQETFTLGVCNGCQMLSNLKSLIPGTEHWPHFVTNMSERFEARVAMVEVMESASVLFADMQGSRMPIAVSHGEGRAEFVDTNGITMLQQQQKVALRYIDNYGNATERYPANPNGSPAGITGLTSADGRCTIMMPHPERVFRAVANSWRSPEWQEDSPWMRLFRNARKFVG